jgi:hypothetical protein
MRRNGEVRTPLRDPIGSPERIRPYRQLDRALHVIINWRMLHHSQTQAYLARRAGHKTDREIRRRPNAMHVT